MSVRSFRVLLFKEAFSTTDTETDGATFGPFPDWLELVFLRVCSSWGLFCIINNICPGFREIRDNCNRSEFT